MGKHTPSTQPPRTRERSRFLMAPAARGTRLTTTIRRHWREARNRGLRVRVRGVSLDLDETARARMQIIEDGSVRYGAIQDHRREGTVALVTARMIAAGGSSAGVHISGEGPGIARGHLLARALGGSGRDVRNLVPLAHNFTNLEQYQRIERAVLYHVLRHGTQQQGTLLGQITLDEARAVVTDPIHHLLHTRGYYHIVRYTVTPIYETSDIYPVALSFSATCMTCGASLLSETALANVIIEE